MYQGITDTFFVSDDFDWLHIASIDQPLSSYFTGNYYGEQGSGGSYRPMVALFFKFGYSLFGLESYGYHLLLIIAHGIAAYLVYLLTLLLFQRELQSKLIALMAAFLFIILPSHVEAITWIAAIADPLVTVFILFSLYAYIRFRETKKWQYCVVSFISFIAGLVTKEVAIITPAIIGLYELFMRTKDSWLHRLRWPVIYSCIVLGYFGIRFAAIGLLAGYYASDTLHIYWRTPIDIITNMVLFDRYRVAAVRYAWFIPLIVAIGLGVHWVIVKNKRALFIAGSFLIALLPTLVLLMSTHGDEGERYGYTASVFFVIMVASFLAWIQRTELLKFHRLYARWRYVPVLSLALFVGLVVYYSFWLNTKMMWWQESSAISRNIVEQLPEALTTNHVNYIVGLPDTYHGAQIMRNGIWQSLELWYPELEFNLELIQTYLIWPDDISEHIVRWLPEQDGWLGQIRSGQPLFTGNAVQSAEGYAVELWGYDYETYRSNQARIMLHDQAWELWKDGLVNFITYDVNGVYRLDVNR